MTDGRPPLPPTLADDELLAGQLRLVLGNVGSGVVPVFLAVSLVGVVLSSSVPTIPLCKAG